MATPPNREEDIVEGALELPAQERAAYLDKLCGNDPHLRQLVDALLHAHRKIISCGEPSSPSCARTKAEAAPRLEQAGDYIGRFKLLQQIGEGGCGVVYKLTNSGGKWTHTVLHAFTGGYDGSGPGARVTVDGAGNVYGMAPTGGAYGLGTIYKIRQGQNGAWVLKVIHAFTGGADGATGSAGRMILRHGDLYGAATTGGTYGSGVVFELTPTQVGEWDFRTIYSFRGQPDGSFPYGALLFDSSGNIYGTTYYGGANNIGAVYQLTPRTNGEWREKVLYSFQGGTDGNSPISNLVFDTARNLYGTTSEGGLGTGTIFKLSPVGGGHWMETVVHMFQGPPDGAFSYNGMVVDPFGNFYGATVHGGVDDDGSIYKFTP